MCNTFMRKNIKKSSVNIYNVSMNVFIERNTFSECMRFNEWFHVVMKREQIFIAKSVNVVNK